MPRGRRPGRSGFLRHRTIEQTDDRREHRFLAHALDTHDERTCDVHCAADQRITHSLRYRPALAGQERFVDVALAFDQNTVRRDRRAWLDQHMIAGFKPRYS